MTIQNTGSDKHSYMSSHERTFSGLHRQRLLLCGVTVGSLADRMQELLTCSLLSWHAVPEKPAAGCLAEAVVCLGDNSAKALRIGTCCGKLVGRRLGRQRTPHGVHPAGPLVDANEENGVTLERAQKLVALAGCVFIFAGFFLSVWVYLCTYQFSIKSVLLRNFNS